MAFYSFFPTKDTTIYENTPLLNTGIDEILELQKTGYDSSRILIDFNINDIADFISTNNIANKEFYLKLFTVDSKEIPINYTIEVYPLAESWDMGIGKKNILPYETTGANWIYRKDGVYWDGTPQFVYGDTADFYTIYNVSGSISGSYLGNINSNVNGTIKAGAVFTGVDGLVFNYLLDTTISQPLYGKLSGSIDINLSGSIEAAFISGTIDFAYNIIDFGGKIISQNLCTQSFDYENTDLDINVTPIINAWLTGSYSANGFLIKMTDTDESKSSYTNLQFFSKDTHTIYPPKLEIRYDDSTFVTSSTINSYTQSYTENVFVPSKTKLTDLTPFYTEFTVPLFPRDATYIFNDSWTYIETKISQSLSNYYKSYTDNFIEGFYTGRLTGTYIGNFTGSLSGSFNNIAPITINNAYISDINELIDINFSGSINGNYSGSITNLSSSLYICGLLNDTYTGLFSGSLNSFAGIYTGSLNGSSFTSGSGTITNSTFSGSLMGNINNSTTGSFIGIFTAGTINTADVYGTISGSLNGLYNGNLNGIYSGTLGLPFNGYVELQQTLNSIFDNTKMHATMSGDFRGYINGNLNNWTSNYEYYLTGNRIYTVTESIDLLPLTDNDIIIYVKNPLFNYKQNSNNLIRVIGRERYPKRTYWNRNTYLDIKYLPTSSYYSIVDAQHDEIIIPFDYMYTKLSCDENGNYFMLNTEGLQPERLYRMIFKIVRGNKIQIFDDNYLFKIIR